MKVLDFGLAKATEPARDSVARSGNVADDHLARPPSPRLRRAGNDGGGDDSRHGGLHVAGAGPREKRRQAFRHLGVRAGPLRMLTGRAAFAGDTITHVLAAIVTREPDWTTLPATTPASVRRLLARCLEKDSKCPLRDIGEARFEIEESTARGPGQRGSLSRLLPRPDPARLAPLAHTSRRSPGHWRESRWGRSPSAPWWLLESGHARAWPKRARSACRSSTPRALKSPRPRFRRTAGSWRIAHDEATACRCFGSANWPAVNRSLCPGPRMPSCPSGRRILATWGSSLACP